MSLENNINITKNDSLTDCYALEHSDPELANSSVQWIKSFT